jgi:hypothetical protein
MPRRFRSPAFAARSPGVGAGTAALLGAALAIVHPADAGPITPDPSDPRWLQQDGAPLFFCGPGDPENFLHRGTRLPDGTRAGDQDAIIQKLVGTGANSLWMTAVRSHGGDGGPTENPFVDNDPDLGVSDAVLDQWEGWISALDAAGIISFFVFYDDGTRVWDTGSAVGPAEASFFQTLVDRFEGYDHLIWCVCEEYSEAYNTTRVSGLAAEIAEHDGRDHPIAAHQHQGHVFHFPDDPNLDVHAMHCGPNNTEASLHEQVLDAWNWSDGRYNVIMAESVNHYGTRTEARRLSWAAAMGGLTVLVHSMDVANTSLDALEDCGRLVSFFESTPFHRLEPRDDLARAGTDYVLGEASVGWIVYASDLSGDLGLSVPAGAGGPHDFRWLDCATGATVEEIGVPLASGDAAWPKPAGLGVDVVVYLEPSPATGVNPTVRPESWAGVKSRYRPAPGD